MVMSTECTSFRDNNFQTVEGQRFLELEELLRDFLLQNVNDPVYAKIIAKQLLNVLKHCDQISYDEPGTAEAYALLHFLDRYHRFQMVFELLHKNGLMPINNRRLDILDVGTGPGPSMFALSDFYTNVYSDKVNESENSVESTFSIDYVERSQEFRNWLHHFTEFANYHSPTTKPWLVPYHHGTFDDFKNLDFNKKTMVWESDDDGYYKHVQYVTKYRFDLIIFSNFLTSKEQTDEFSKEIENCARYLRHKGILIVVGSGRHTEKYKQVYETLERTILDGCYNNKNVIAKCNKVILPNSVMQYSWNDNYGNRLKGLINSVMEKLQLNAKEDIPKELAKILNKTIQPGYSRSIEWEVLVFQKKAKPRQKKSKDTVNAK